jgi:hypothetical protein
MSVYELLDYDRLLERIGIPDQQDWRCGDNPPDLWQYNEDGLRYDDIMDPDHLTTDTYRPFGSAYDGRALRHAGGLCLNSDINVNGLLLNHRDHNGTIWVCTDIEGWWTLPPSEISDVPRPYWDGSMLTTGRYLSRTITISGAFMPPDKSYVWYNRDLLIRVASIVRGVGLIAVCGNGSSPIDYTDPEYFEPFYDPSKMSIIQMNDVPLIETTKPNGFTQFSLSFKCVYPAKLSVGERVQTIPFPLDATGGSVLKYRKYLSFSRKTAMPGEVSGAGEPEGTGVTAYIELARTLQGNDTRKYADVRLYNPTNLIEDEDNETTTLLPEEEGSLDLVNKGNYFAFPVYVFDSMSFNSTYVDEGGATHPVPAQDKFLEITNTATGETMRVIKEIGPLQQLVVDTSARRVSLIDRDEVDSPQSWDWNARDYLSLDSAWVTLASGTNKLSVSGPITFKGNQPVAYWRDSWIG